MLWPCIRFGDGKSRCLGYMLMLFLFCCFFVLFLFVCFVLFVVLQSLQDLSSLTRDRNWALGSESTECKPLDCQGIPYVNASSCPILLYLISQNVLKTEVCKEKGKSKFISRLSFIHEVFLQRYFPYS